MGDEYHDIDAILADQQKLPCIFKCDVKGLGHLDDNNEADVYILPFLALISFPPHHTTPITKTPLSLLPSFVATPKSTFPSGSPRPSPRRRKYFKTHSSRPTLLRPLTRSTSRFQPSNTAATSFKSRVSLNPTARASAAPSTRRPRQSTFAGYAPTIIYLASNS
ncbi:hypothetical protein BC937DRAFT_87323 [Endogone sp. FLAS-F59071]|nr:hypothetical protein BC937DRAFT_87323 [Endogone sp. FLAS-F59071]|eukprot:RUS19543.1 hypothetical protein BC937DRAFT_87323 [Endogone sp. FLAS-F59071]